LVEITEITAHLNNHWILLYCTVKCLDVTDTNHVIWLTINQAIHWRGFKQHGPPKWLGSALGQYFPSFAQYCLMWSHPQRHRYAHYCYHDFSKQQLEPLNWQI